MDGIGSGLATTGPVANNAHLTDFAKWVLSYMMLLGRLELFMQLIIFHPAFWRRYGSIALHAHGRRQSFPFMELTPTLGSTAMAFSLKKDG